MNDKVMVKQKVRVGCMVAENKKNQLEILLFLEKQNKKTNQLERKKEKKEKTKIDWRTNQTNLKLKEKGRGSSWSHQTIPTQTTKSGHICEQYWESGESESGQIKGEREKGGGRIKREEMVS